MNTSLHFGDATRLPVGNRPRPLTSGWSRVGRGLLVAAVGLLGTQTVQAQLNYAASGAANATGTYTSLGAGTTLITTPDFDDSNSGAQAIGFSFSFNGTAFTQFVLNTNGFIKLGSVAPSVGALYTPLSSANALDVNIIAPLANDLVASTTVTPEYRVTTTGTSPTQVCTIQWKGVRDYSATTSQFASEEFQVKLYEGSNRIEFVYGTWTLGPAAALGRNHEVGIKGTTNGSIDRVQAAKPSSATSWASPNVTFAAGTNAASGPTFFVRNTFLPDAGRTFRFDPKPNNDVAVAAVYTLGQLPTPAATPHVVKAVIANNGAAATTSRTVTLAVTGANTFSDTQTVPALAVGATATVTFASYSPTVAGTNVVTVSVPADDVATNNSQALNQQVNTTGLFGYVSLPIGTLAGISFGAAPATGSVASRFTTASARTVTAVNIYLTTATGTVTGRLYDASGNVLGSSAATAFTSVGLKTLTLTAPVVIGAGDFLVGGSLANAASVGFQTEVPTRPATFYQVNAGPALVDLASNNFGKAYIEAVTSAPPACSSVTGLQTPSLAAGTLTATSAQLVFGAGGGVVDYTVTYTPSGGTATTVTPSQSTSPVTISGLTPNTAYTATIQTNCGSGINSGTPLSVTFTTPFANDLTVNAVYSLGQVPQTYGSPHAVQARITNSGSNTQTGTVVTLTVTGATPTTLTQAVTLAPGASTVVTFTGYALSATGANAITVAVPADDNATGNSGAYTQNVSTDRLSYISGATLNANGVGVGTAGGYVAVKYTLPNPGGATIGGITPTFTGAGAGATTYKLVIFDATGAGGTPGTALYTSPVLTRPTATSSPVLSVPNVAVPANGIFFVALQELDLNVALGWQTESPLRNGAFYFRGTATGAWTDLSTTTLLWRIAMEASIVPAPSCFPISGLTATPGTTTATLNFTPSTSGVTNYSVVVTPQGGTALPAQTATASPVSLTGLASGTQYTAVVTTNCTGANGSSTPVSVTFTTLNPVPANDQCANATVITCGSTVTGTTVGSTSAGKPTAAVNGVTPFPTQAGGVFYQFTGTGDRVTFSLCSTANTAFDSEIFVYSGTCAAATAITADDDGCGGGSGLSSATVLTTPGTNYLIFVSGFSSGVNRSAFALTTTCATPDLIVSTTTPIGGTYRNVTIANGGVATLNADLSVSGTVTVQSGGSLQTDPTSYYVRGTGRFVLAAGGTLIETNTVGITNTGSGGFLLTGTNPMQLSTDANYVFAATGAQVTGPLLPAQARNLTVNNSLGLTLTNALRVAQVVRLQSGNLATGTTNNLTLLSTPGFSAGLSAGRTALIDNTGGVVTGTANVMQRAIDNVYNGDNIGYHHFSSPMTGTTLGDLSDPGFAPVFNDATGSPAFNATAAVGYVRPFPTVLGYDQSRVGSPTLAVDQTPFNQGYFAGLSAGTTWVPGTAYAVNSPNAVTLDFTGQFNNAPTATTFAGLAGLTRGTNADAGWQLLGNPFPAPLDFTTVAFATQATNLDPSIYQYHSTSRYGGYFTTYQGNMALGVQPTVPAGGGFFMRVTAPGTPGSLSLSNVNRVTSYAAGAQASFGRSATTRPVLTLTATAANGLSDALTVYAQAGATAGLDPRFDAAKLTNPNGLNLAARAGTDLLAIDGLPAFAAATVVPLALAVPAAGTYALAVTELANFGSTQVYLRDAATGTDQLLSAGTQVRLTLASATAGATRYALVFRPAGALATAPNALAAQATVYPNPAHDRFTLTLPPVAGQQEVRATLVNALGQVVNTRTLALPATGTTAAYATSGLAAGVYALRLTAGSQTATLRVVVQ